MVMAFNMIVFLLAIALLAMVLLKNKRVDTTLMMAVILICSNCFGRYLQAAAETLETAVLANRFIYVGACYIPLLMVVFLQMENIMYLDNTEKLIKNIKVGQKSTLLILKKMTM